MKEYKQFFSEARSLGRDEDGKKRDSFKTKDGEVLKSKIDPEGASKKAQKARDASTPEGKKKTGEAAGSAIRSAQRQKKSRKEREGLRPTIDPSSKPKDTDLASKRSKDRKTVRADSRVVPTTKKGTYKVAPNEGKRPKGTLRSQSAPVKNKYQKDDEVNKLATKALSDMGWKGKNDDYHGPPPIGRVLAKHELKKRQNPSAIGSGKSNAASDKMKSDAYKSNQERRDDQKKLKSNFKKLSRVSDRAKSSTEDKNKVKTAYIKPDTQAKKYGRSETEKEAARAAEREKIQAPEVRRKAAAEPLSGGDVKKQARLNLRKQLKGKSAEERKQGFKNARTPMATARRTASAVVGARVKKEKERLKTDPVGQVKKYASGVAGAAKATVRAMNPNSSGVSKTGGGSSTERGVRYQ